MKPYLLYVYSETSLHISCNEPRSVHIKYEHSGMFRLPRFHKIATTKQSECDDFRFQCSVTSKSWDCYADVSSKISVSLRSSCSAHFKQIAASILLIFHAFVSSSYVEHIKVANVAIVFNQFLLGRKINNSICNIEG